MPGARVLVRIQSYLHCSKGKLGLQAFPLQHRALKLFSLCSRLRVVKIFYKRLREKKITVEVVHFGLVMKLEGSTPPWQWSYIFFFHTRYDLFATVIQEEAAVPDGMSSAVSCQSAFSVTPSFSLAQCFMALSSFGHIYMSCGACCEVFQASKIQANSEAENAAPESCRQTHQSQLV